MGWHREAFGVTEKDRATLVAGVGFDASAWETWPYLAAGAALHVVPEAARTEPAALRDWLVAERITVTFLPTPPGGERAAAGLAGGRGAAGGAGVRPSAALPFTLVNNYGPTENTVVATSGAVAAKGGVPSIGRTRIARVARRSG